MFFDIFSVFDDHNFVFMGLASVLWVSVIVSVLCMFFFYWVSSGYLFEFFSFILSLVSGLVDVSLGKRVGGSVVFFCCLFMSLMCFNVLGLVPYVFSITSHLCINLVIAFPFWLSIVLMSIIYDCVGFFSHLQPLGAPVFLSPFLCLIELVSIVVRPLTLCVRLTANLSTGHILVGLLGSGFVFSNFSLGLLILFIVTFYFLFELGVCFVQAYIFTLLPTLYLDEHPY